MPRVVSSQLASHPLLKRSKGFTLAELLIALAILGVIATFTIPKVLSSQQDSKNSAIAQEAAGMIAGAFDAYKQTHTVTNSTSTKDLTPYLNYALIQTSGLVDKNQTEDTFDCAAATCLKMHNGSVFYLFDINFAGTSSTNTILFYLDPDGVGQSTTDGPGKSVVFFLYPNGRISTYGSIAPGSTSSWGAHNTCPGCDPPWFHWGG